MPSPAAASSRRRGAVGRALATARTALLAVSLSAALLAGCSTTGADEPTRSSGQDGYVGGQQSLTQVPPDERQQAPVAAGPALGSDATVSTADFAGKVVVLNAWASWCNPCRQEAPELQQAAVQTAEIAQFLGINSRDYSSASAEAFIRVNNITYPSIYDAEGKVLLNFAGKLPLSTFPSTLVIDRQGRIAVRITGTISAITLVALVEEVAAGR